MKYIKVTLIWLAVTAYVMIVYAVASTPVKTTNPEQGITCITVKSIWGKDVGAGCYRGDIHKDNTLDVVATKKYQSNQ